MAWIKIKSYDINEELGLVSKLLPEKDVKDINKILEKTGFTKKLERTVKVMFLW